ncbi:MAG: hypothetical protein ACLSAF_05710 [Intestinimonas sp.]
MDYPNYGRLVGTVALSGPYSGAWPRCSSHERCATTVHIHSDRKGLSKERQKKIVQGHRADDHEEQQTIS